MTISTIRDGELTADHEVRNDSRVVRIFQDKEFGTCNATLYVANDSPVTSRSFKTLSGATRWAEKQVS